jgi:hypothetical protein
MRKNAKVIYILKQRDYIVRYHLYFGTERLIFYTKLSNPIVTMSSFVVINFSFTKILMPSIIYIWLMLPFDKQNLHPLSQ